jgi:Ca2+-binding EF-hand superfamily protein
MGCQGSKDPKPGAKAEDAPKKAPAKKPAPKPKSTTATASELAQANKQKLCREIVDKMDESGDGVMQQEELQILVKHLDPAFINVPTHQIQIQDPKIKALIGKDKRALVDYLSNTYEENWIKVFHQFLGLGDKTTGFPASKPGVYEVAWEGGVRYRTQPSYQKIADEEQLALPQTQFEVKEFIMGDDGLEYAYLYWARYFLPTRFHNGEPMLKRIGEPGTSEQLKTLAYDLFREIDTSGDEQAEWEEITSFLDGAEIAYNKEALKQDFEKSDVNGDGKLSLDEFIEAYKRGSISDIFCIPTRNRQKVPHHSEVKQGNATA